MKNLAVNLVNIFIRNMFLTFSLEIETENSDDSEDAESQESMQEDSSPETPPQKSTSNQGIVAQKSNSSGSNSPKTELTHSQQVTYLKKIIS